MRFPRSSHRCSWPTRIPNQGRRGRGSLRSRRRGAVIIELAIMLPIFVLIILGTIEAASMIYLKQSLKIAAYESARVSLVKGSDAGNVEGAAYNILTARGISAPTVTITPSNFDSTAYGTPIRIEVTVPCNSNSVLPPLFFQGQSITSQVTMMKE